MLLKPKLVVSWVSSRLDDPADEAFCEEGLLEGERALDAPEADLASTAVWLDQWMQREILGRALRDSASDERAFWKVDVYVACEWVLMLCAERRRGTAPIYLDIRRLALALWLQQRPIHVRALLEELGFSWEPTVAAVRSIARDVPEWVVPAVEPFDVRWAAVARDSLAKLDSGARPTLPPDWLRERAKRVRSSAPELVSSWAFTAMFAPEAADLATLDGGLDEGPVSWSRVHALEPACWPRATTLVRAASRRLTA